MAAMRTRRRRARLTLAAAALAVTGALGAAGTATADVTTTVNGSNLSVTGTAGDDTIVFGTANGFLTVNGVATTLAADPESFIGVDAGGGNDTVDTRARPPRCC